MIVNFRLIVVTDAICSTSTTNGTATGVFCSDFLLLLLNENVLLFLIKCRSHPYFISKEAYKELVEGTGLMTDAKAEDWVKETVASWRHTIWLGIKDPRGWIFKPKTYLKCFRDAYCLERMHRAFKRGLMEYGMWAATKKVPPSPAKEDSEAVHSSWNGQRVLAMAACGARELRRRQMHRPNPRRLWRPTLQCS